MHSPLKISSKSLYEKRRRDIRVLLQSLLMNRPSNEAISEGRIGNSTGPKMHEKRCDQERKKEFDSKSKGPGTPVVKVN